VSHLDPEQLALVALGEPVASAAERAHLETCVGCALELAAMSRTVMIARSTMDDAALEAPPERVWDEVIGELGLVGALDADRGSPSVSPAPSAPTEESTVRRRPRRRMLWGLAASLVLIAGAVLGTWAVVARVAPVSVAEASLAAFPDHRGAVGTADVERARDGSLTLVVSLEHDDVPDAYREVWLIRNDAEALISLGVLDGSTGSFSIPRDVDLNEYSLVDISAEPVDGDPTHSGDSIVRGKLSFG
jgi:hypothetical protein